MSLSSIGERFVFCYYVRGYTCLKQSIMEAKSDVPIYLGKVISYISCQWWSDHMNINGLEIFSYDTVLKSMVSGTLEAL